MIFLFVIFCDNGIVNVLFKFNSLVINLGFVGLFGGLSIFGICIILVNGIVLLG